MKLNLILFMLGHLARHHWKIALISCLPGTLIIIAPQIPVYTNEIENLLYITVGIIAVLIANSLQSHFKGDIIRSFATMRKTSHLFGCYMTKNQVEALINDIKNGKTEEEILKESEQEIAKTFCNFDFSIKK